MTPDKKGAPQRSFSSIVRLHSVERLNDFLAHLLRVREQHHRIVPEEQLVLDPGIAGRHSAFDEQHRLGVFHVQIGIP